MTEIDEALPILLFLHTLIVCILSFATPFCACLFNKHFNALHLILEHGDHLTALDNVALTMKVAGTDAKRARGYAKELLHWVGLGDHLHSYPPILSDGQKQRVAIARAVITRPLLLLADEPTGNIDEPAAYKLMLLFEELNKIGTTIVLATHNRGLVSTFSYPELQLYQGQLTVNNPVSRQQTLRY